MAKKAIKNHLACQLDAMTDGKCLTMELTSHLPLEKAGVLVDGVKQTTDVSKGLKQVMGHQQVREFYATPNKKDKVIMENNVSDTAD